MALLIAAAIGMTLARVPAPVTIAALGALIGALLLDSRRYGAFATSVVVYEHNDARLWLSTARGITVTEIDHSRWLFRFAVLLSGRARSGRRVRLVLFRPAVSADALRRFRLWDLARCNA